MEGKMKDIKKTMKILTVTAVICAFAFSFPVFAKPLQIDVERSRTDNTVVVTSIGEKNELVTIQILPENITPELIETENSNGSNAVYVLNRKSDENGSVSFTAELENGKYIVYMASATSEGVQSSQPFTFTVLAEYTPIINALKTHTDTNKDAKTEFVDEIAINKSKLGFDIDIYSENAVKRFYDEYNTALSDTDFDLNLKNFKKSAVIETLNSGSQTDVVSYIKEIYKSDTVFMNFMNKHMDNATKEAFYLKVLRSVTANSNGVTNSDDLFKKAKQALVLTAVKYPVEANNIKIIMDEYKDVLGISGVSSYASVYRSLENNEYTTIPLYIEAYNAAVAVAAGSGNGSGGGNGGGSGGGAGGGNKVTPSSGTSGIVSFPSTAGQTQNIKIFDDIDDVSWATESIEALYKAGIVSGKGDQKFYPQDKVLREEYVKMLVATFDLKLVGDDLPFTDVPENAWFYDYVKTAYIAEVVSGINEIEFGAGQNITRQDICVMTYRMLNECDVEIPRIKEQLNFNDSDEISDYAKEAVVALQMAGIINGDDIGNFNPKATATRAETAKIMYGIYTLIERG